MPDKKSSGSGKDDCIFHWNSRPKQLRKLKGREKKAGKKYFTFFLYPEILLLCWAYFWKAMLTIPF